MTEHPPPPDGGDSDATSGAPLPPPAGAPTPPPGWSTSQPPPYTGYGAYGPQPGGGYAPPPGQPSGQYAYPGYPGSPAWLPPPVPVAPKPGIVPLRPLGIGELLDGSISAVRGHPKAMLGFSAVLIAISQVVQLFLSWFLLGDFDDTSNLESDSTFADFMDEMAAPTAAILVTLLISWLTQILLTGVLTVVVSRLVLGDHISLAAAWARLRPHLWGLLGVSFLTGLAITAIFVVLSAPGVILLVAGAGPLGASILVLGLIAAASLGVWAYVSLALAGSALVLERVGVVTALRRSIHLTKRSFWRIFGVLLLATVLVQVISSVLAMPFQVVGMLVFGGDMFTDPNATVGLGFLTFSALGAIVGGTLAYPFAAAVSVLLYVDQRMRREGLDLELARASSPTASSPTPSPTPPPAPQHPQPPTSAPPPQAW